MKKQRIFRAIAIFSTIVILLTTLVACNLSQLEGKDGTDGKDGLNGKDGADGKNGIGIASTEMDENGNIVITYTDGTVEIVEHNWIYAYTLKAPTCTEMGIDLYSCRDCSLVRMVTTEKMLVHNFGDWIVIKDATTTEEGLQERYCECGEKEAELISTKFSEGLSFAINYDTLTYSVTGIGTCVDTDIVIPTEYNGIQVTSIYHRAFMGDKFSSVKIPDSVTSIGNEAFQNCTSLTSVEFDDNSQLTSIGDSAFYRCSSLTSIVIPASVNSIGDYAFMDCDSLNSVTFEGTVEQWKAIKKGFNWNFSSGSYTIYCTDGEIAKDGTVSYY